MVVVDGVEYLNGEEGAAYLGMSPTTFRSNARHLVEQIPVVWPGNARWYRKSALDEVRDVIAPLAKRRHAGTEMAVVTASQAARILGISRQAFSTDYAWGAKVEPLFVEKGRALYSAEMVRDLAGARKNAKGLAALPGMRTGRASRFHWLGRGGG